jgi:hypothetical protein
MAGVRLRDGEIEAALTGRERITNHAEYLGWNPESARYSSGLVRTTGQLGCVAGPVASGLVHPFRGGVLMQAEGTT